MQHKQLLALSLLSLTTINLTAQVGSNQLSGGNELNTITTSLPFLAITPESRGGSMGDAGTALSANSTSIYWNTAMLNFAKEDGEISVSYTPWLRQLTNDISLSYVAGYHKINNRMAIAGSLRYFSLGSITFTNNDAQVIREDKPNEFELALGYAFKLSDRSSIGVNGKFANSNLTKGLTIPGATTKAANAGIADISYAFRNPDINWFGYNGTYAFGVTLNNIGNKVAYSETQRRDFIPMNLKIGNAWTGEFDKYNSLTVSVDVQKLLVPTPAKFVYDAQTENYVMASGRSSDVGIIAGMMQSFYDAPGTLVKDANGDYVRNADGSYQVEKGSKFKEELREINIGTGLEYWYNNVFALRGGFFYESVSKGGRQFFTTGIALQYNIFGIDISYLAALKRNNPLANTLRFTLRFTLGAKQKEAGNDAPE